LNSSAKEKITIANAPTISKSGPKKLKNDTGSKLINANPESIDAKNKKINSILISLPLVIEYDYKGEGDWIFEEILQFYYKKTDRKTGLFKNTLLRKYFCLRQSYLIHTCFIICNLCYLDIFNMVILHIEYFKGIGLVLNRVSLFGLIILG
jgi:hypothetical protein